MWDASSALNTGSPTVIIITAPMPVMANPPAMRRKAYCPTLLPPNITTTRLVQTTGHFEREGIHLSPSNGNWMMAAARRLEPIYNELRELVKDGYYVMADETPHPNLKATGPVLHRGWYVELLSAPVPYPLFEYPGTWQQRNRHAWQDRFGWYRVTVLQCTMSSTHCRKLHLLLVNTSGASLWKWRKMIL